jgi:hypothetical protein
MFKLRRKKALVRKAFPLPYTALNEMGDADYRGQPTFCCPCGCEWFIMCVQFDVDERLPGFYLTDGLCAACGSLVTLPTPVDGEKHDENYC